MSEEILQDELPQKGSGLVLGWDDLRAAREAAGLSFSQVSAQLKLTPRQIEAIEAGDFSALPGKTFSRGFVRNYARFLHLEADAFLALMDAREVPEPNPISIQMYPRGLGKMPGPGRSRLSILPAAVLVLVLVLVLGAGWHFHWFEAREEAALLEHADLGLVETADSSPGFVDLSLAQGAMTTAVAVVSAPPPVIAQPSSSQSALAPAALAITAQSAAEPPAVGVVGLPRVILRFAGDAWVEARDSTDKLVFARLSQAGVVQEIQGAGPFFLVIGNASKVKLSWKGKELDLEPYTRGDVARVTVR